MSIENRRLRVAMLGLVGTAVAVTSAPLIAADLEEIIVTARKRDERLQDVPLSIEAFSSEKLDEMNVTDLYALTHFTPGFSFERNNRYGVQGGANRPVIRGMSSVLGEGNASMFVDGILFSDNILSFPMDLVDRIEVIKGPQAALFGRATFSGAINFITKKGTNTPENKVKVRFAQYDDYEANVLSRGPIVEDKLFYLLHARYYSFGGMYRNSLDGRRVGDEESVNVNGSLEYRSGGIFSGILNGGITRDRDGHPALVLQDRFQNNCHLNAPRQYYCGDVKEYNRTTLDIAGLEGKDGLHRDSLRLSAQLTWDLPSGHKVVSNSGLFSTEQEFGYDSTYQGATAIAPLTVPGAPGYVRATSDPVRNGGVMRNEVTDRDEWSTELRLQSDERARLQYLVGAYYYTSDRSYEERHFLATAPTVNFGQTTVKNQAVFGSIGSDITERWDWTAELRYAQDEISNQKPGRAEIGKKFYSVSPRVTTSYKLTADNLIYANYAKGNKPGVINADPRFPANIQFADEESSDNYEIGTKNTFLDGRLRTNIAAYYIDWKDQQVTTTYFIPPAQGGGSVSYLRNAGKTEVKGVEIVLDARLTEQLSAGGTYAYTDSQFIELRDTEAGQLFGDTSVKGKHPPGVPQNQGSLYAKYEFPVREDMAFIRADVSYTDEKYAQIYNLASTGDQVLANLSIGLQHDQWDFTVFVTNLTDDRTPSSVVRWIDQMNLNVPQYVNANPAQNNVPGSPTSERAFWYPLAPKRQVGLTASYRF